jgi:hypothetical protein
VVTAQRGKLPPVSALRGLLESASSAAAEKDKRREPNNAAEENEKGEN